MEFVNFLKVLLRYKYTLILIPLISVIVTFLLVRRMNETYKSTTRIATGLVERSDTYINKENNSYGQEAKVSQEFSNIIQMIMLKRIINQVTYQLMLHDLSDSSPYREPSKLVKELSESEKKRAVEILRGKFNKMEELSPYDKDQKFLNKIIVSMKYDYKSLTKTLSVYRLENSDYLIMDFSSENPQLSAFVLNFLTKETIDYYTSLANQNKNVAVNYLDSVMRAKQASLTAKMEALKNYKIRNNVLDVSQQGNVLMGQIAEFETRKQEAKKNIAAYSGALSSIDQKFDPKDRKYLESTVTSANQNIMATRNRLNAVNDEYIKNNFDPKYKGRLDSLQSTLVEQINESNDRSSSSPLSSKQDIVKQKLELETNLALAKNSVASLDGEVNNLSRKLNVLAPNQATIQSFEKDIEVESREYVDLSKKHDEAVMESSFPIKLRQVEMAIPTAAEPSKKILIVALSGLVSFIICAGVLFVLFYLDKTVNDSQSLANKTQQNVIGVLNLIIGPRDAADVWNKEYETPAVKQFKTYLRSIRFEIESELNGAKVLGITSLHSYEGKTFLAQNLATAYKMINKKVLLIDGNFDNPQISGTVTPDFYLEDYLLSKIDIISLISAADKNLFVMGNKGDDISLLEITISSTIHLKLKELEDYFDIILIEIPALELLNKAREWISFSEKVISVFESGQSIENENKEIKYLNSLKVKMLGWVMNKVATEEEKPKRLQAPQKRISLYNKTPSE